MTKAGLRLTERDRAILKFLYEARIATRAEIGTRFWPTNTSHNHNTRLRKLEEARYISAIKGDRGLPLGYGLAAKGRALFERKLPRRERDIYKRPRYRTTFDHDGFVREVERELSLSGRLSSFKFEAQVRRDLASSKFAPRRTKVPDGIAIFSSARFERVAVEVEMATKSQRRYGEMVARLKFCAEADAVVVLCARNHIAKSLATELANAKEMDDLRPWKVDCLPFAFVRIDDFSRVGLNANILFESPDKNLHDWLFDDSQPFGLRPENQPEFENEF